ncbi:MAG: protease inhibitor I42 family protein [Reyranellaceae bacterium]
MHTIRDQDNDRRVLLHVGEPIEIRLAENASTGYRWALESHDAGLLEPVEVTASYPGAAVGSGGEAIFRFRAVAAGSTTLALKYWRHWEGAGSAIRHFSVTFDIAP